MPPLRQYFSVSNIYFLGYCLMVAGLPLSNFLMSVSQFVLAAAWFCEGNYKEKFLRFFKCKSALALSSIYLIHLLGLLYTTDYGYALHDLRIKLPLFGLTFILCTAPKINPANGRMIIQLFLFSVFSGTVAGITELYGFNNTLRRFSGFPERILVDRRGISLFISHIRFGLQICLSVFIILDMLLFNHLPLKKSMKILSLILLAWFITFLFILESLSGIVIFLAIVSGMVTFFLYKNFKGIAKITTIAFFWMIIILSVISMNNFFSKPEKTGPVPIELEQHTPAGNSYVHDTSSKMTINGNRVWIYICWKELESSWNKRSRFSFVGHDLKNQEIKYTLISFLTSKGLRKDSAGVGALSEEEVRAVERGITNAEALQTPGLKFRLMQIFSEYRDYAVGGNPSGSSTMQRLEFWKAAAGIIVEHPLIGVGTGDGPNAYIEQYKKMSTPLEKNFRLRAHNQFLAIGVSFGIIGMLWFTFAIFSPFIFEKKYCDFLFIAFFTTVFLSMFNEDTLESQAGISFFVFFYCFLLFHYQRDGS